MTAKFFAILTNQGAARLANAAALGTKLNLTQMAVGDANGKLPVPDPAQTKLINQKRIASLNMLSVDPKNTSQIIAEQVIPENEGGWWIREIGLYDDAGVLIAVANCPETYKPLLQEGSGRTQTIRMLLIVSSASAITLKIDPAVVLATRQYADDKAIEVKGYFDEKMRLHEQSRNHPDGTLAAKGFVQLSSSVESTSEQHAATPKAVKIAMDNGTARLAKDRNLADLPNPALARQSLSLGDSATKNTGKTTGTVAAGDDPRIAGAVQNTRKVNGKPLSDDVVITSQDVFSESTRIQVDADLNSYTSAGLSYQPTPQSGNNYPYNGAAGSLEVLKAGNTSIRQVFSAWDSTRTYFRAFNGSSNVWTAWDEAFTKLRPPTADDVGALSTRGGSLTDTLSVSDSGRGSFVSQYNVPAPIFKEINSNSPSEYWPIFKQRYVQGKVSWSAGMLINSGDFFVHMINEAGKMVSFIFKQDGTFSPNNYANFDAKYLAINAAAVAANKLAKTVKVSGVDFDGSKNIDIPIIGIGQKWANVLASRTAGVTYTNNTPAPIMISLVGRGSDTSKAAVLLVDNVAAGHLSASSAVAIERPLSAIVPPGATYKIDPWVHLSGWSELR